MSQGTGEKSDKKKPTKLTWPEQGQRRLRSTSVQSYWKQSRRSGSPLIEWVQVFRILGMYLSLENSRLLLEWQQQLKVAATTLAAPPRWTTRTSRPPPFPTGALCSSGSPPWPQSWPWSSAESCLTYHSTLISKGNHSAALFLPLLFVHNTTLQSIMNAKLKQRFWHLYENGLIKTI